MIMEYKLDKLGRPSFSLIIVRAGRELPLETKLQLAYCSSLLRTILGDQALACLINEYE